MAHKNCPPAEGAPSQNSLSLVLGARGTMGLKEVLSLWGSAKTARGTNGTTAVDAAGAGGIGSAVGKMLLATTEEGDPAKAVARV